MNALWFCCNRKRLCPSRAMLSDTPAAAPIRSVQLYTLPPPAVSSHESLRRNQYVIVGSRHKSETPIPRAGVDPPAANVNVNAVCRYSNQKGTIRLAIQNGATLPRRTFTLSRPP